MHTARRIDPIYDTVLIDDSVRSLFIATHGFQLSHTDAARLNTVSPIHVLMSPFNRYRLPSLLGGLVSSLDGLKTLVEQTNPAVVLRTHDEDKHHKGLVSKLATIDRFTGDMLSRHPWLSDRYSPMTDYSPVTYQPTMPLIQITCVTSLWVHSASAPTPSSTVTFGGGFFVRMSS